QVPGQDPRLLVLRPEDVRRPLGRGPRGGRPGRAGGRRRRVVPGGGGGRAHPQGGGRLPGQRRRSPGDRGRGGGQLAAPGARAAALRGGRDPAAGAPARAVHGQRGDGGGARGRAGGQGCAAVIAGVPGRLRDAGDRHRRCVVLGGRPPRPPPRAIG